ncbi:MAG: hypothetical protein AB8H03_06225 [Saprospiraceae bacterium]
MENNISQSAFLDFSVIPLNEPLEMLKKCSGSNQKKLLVVFNKNDESEERLEFLKKILAAAKFDIEKDILLLKITPKETFSFIALRTKIAQTHSSGGIDNLLIFGFEPKHFGLNLEVQKYVPFHFYENGFLFADGLSMIENDKALKGALWGGMKTLFLK